MELGSGSSTKTNLLLEHLDKPVGYVPIDISREHLLNAATRLSREFFPLEILPVCGDYNLPFILPTPQRNPDRTVVFFPGSTIGNFEPPQAVEFLQRMASLCQEDDGLLIGVDLRKDKRILERAYNDAKGVTAAFNLNVLARANRELDANFQLRHFRHRAIFDEIQSRIEMHLVSTQPQRVRVFGTEIQFKSGEHITTEFSYKYSLDAFHRLACASGWRPVKTWTDSQRWFGVHFLSRANELFPEGF